MSREPRFHRSIAATTERPQDARTIDAEKAEPVIRRAMLEGGMCSVEAEGRRRVLVHDPKIDAPLSRWIWPFPLFAPHRVRFILYEGTLPATTMEYDRKRIDEAVKYFLLGLPPKAKVIVTRDRASARG